MDLRDIEIFLVLTEELHFGRTAERMFVSQSRVSQTIRSLENRVGGPLFERTSRKVAITPLGEQVRDGLRVGLDQINRVLRDARSAASGLTGDLRVGLLNLAAGGSGFDDAVARLEQAHPGCRISVLEAFPGKALARLRAGELDAVVHWLPLHQPDVTVGPVLLDAPAALAVRAGDALVIRGWATMEDLGDHAVLDADGIAPTETVDSFTPRRTPSGRPIERRGREGRMAEVLSLVARGDVVHPTVMGLPEYYSHPGVAVIPLRDAPRRRSALVWLTGNDGPLLQAFAHECG